MILEAQKNRTGHGTGGPNCTKRDGGILHGQKTLRLGGGENTKCGQHDQCTAHAGIFHECSKQILYVTLTSTSSDCHVRHTLRVCLALQSELCMRTRKSSRFSLAIFLSNNALSLLTKPIGLGGRKMSFSSRRGKSSTSIGGKWQSSSIWSKVRSLLESRMLCNIQQVCTIVGMKSIFKEDFPSISLNLALSIPSPVRCSCGSTSASD